MANALKGNAMTESHSPSEIAQSAKPQISAASALIGDPAQFGRVAEDGTVFVRTPQGEKAVGSYPGKSAEEALAYFVRKFEALASEVALTAARVTSGAMVPQDAYEAVKKLRQQVSELNGVGDLAALAASVEQIEPLIEGHREAYEAKKAAESAAKAERRAQILVEKEKIVAEAESLALSEAWKATGDRLEISGSDSQHLAISLISVVALTLHSWRPSHLLSHLQRKQSSLKLRSWQQALIGSQLLAAIKLLWISGRPLVVARRTTIQSCGIVLRQLRINSLPQRTLI
jgi:hypothetical protein